MEKSLEVLSEQTSIVEKIADLLQKQHSEAVTESRKRKLEESVREVDDFRGSLDKRGKVLKERQIKVRDLAFLKEELDSKLKKIEAEEERLRLARESLAEKNKKINVVIDALDGRITAVEEKEEEFNLFVEGKKREMALREEKLEEKLKEYAEKVKLAEEKFRVHEFVERMEWAESRLDTVRGKMDERLEKIEFRGNVGWESLALTVKEADSIRDLAEKKLQELEKREKEFCSFQEEKTRELVSKEKLLDVMSKKLVKDTELRNEQLVEREKLGHQLLERLRLANDNVEGQRRSVHERNEEIALKMQELASKEQILNMTSRELVKDAELRNEQLMEREKVGHKLLERLQLAKDNVEGIVRSVEERLKEIDLKMQELASKEELLNGMSRELVKDAQSRNKQLIEGEKSGYQLLEWLKLAQYDVEEMKRRVHKRFIELSSKETELHSLSDWIEMKMDETDWKEKEFEEREQRITKIEDRMISKRDELQEKEDRLIFKENELKEKETSLRAWQKELEDKEVDIVLAQKSNEHRLEKIDAREKSLREFIRQCFKEHLATKRELRIHKDSVDKSARDLVRREEHLLNAAKEVEIREKQMRDRVKELEFQRQHLNSVSFSPLGMEPDKSADLKFTVRMDGKTLQMFLNEPDKDLESMADEIFKVLHLSFDPAKLVLDAMEGFYPPHLRKEDVDVNVRRTCITLLQQLSKMSPNIIIKPHVKKEAIELATSWKSKIRATGENAVSLEVFGFLSLLSAFDLTSHFDKAEIHSLLKILDQHIQIPELHHVLGSVSPAMEF